MAEKQLEITQRNGTDGKVYNNIDLKQLEGPSNDSVILEKTFPDGKKFERTGQFGPYSFYGVNCKYQGQQVSTLMNQKVYDNWLKMPMGNVKLTAKLIKNKKGLYQTVIDMEAVA